MIGGSDWKSAVGAPLGHECRREKNLLPTHVLLGESDFERESLYRWLVVVSAGQIGKLGSCWQARGGPICKIMALVPADILTAERVRRAGKEVGVAGELSASMPNFARKPVRWDVRFRRRGERAAQTPPKCSSKAEISGSITLEAVWRDSLAGSASPFCRCCRVAFNYIVSDCIIRIHLARSFYSTVLD